MSLFIYTYQYAQPRTLNTHLTSSQVKYFKSEIWIYINIRAVLINGTPICWFIVMMKSLLWAVFQNTHSNWVRQPEYAIAPEAIDLKR